MCKIGYLVIAGFLLVISVIDVKKKQLPIWLLIIMSLLIVILRMVCIEDTWCSTIGGIAVGVVFFVIGKLTKEAIGYGDCWIILLLGIVLGGMKIVEVVLSASFTASLFSIAYCIKKGWDKEYAIPFAPFLTIAYLGVMLV